MSKEIHEYTVGRPSRQADKTLSLKELVIAVKTADQAKSAPTPTRAGSSESKATTPTPQVNP